VSDLAPLDNAIDSNAARRPDQFVDLPRRDAVGPDAVME